MVAQGHGKFAIGFPDVTPDAGGVFAVRAWARRCGVAREWLASFKARIGKPWASCWTCRTAAF